jgi:tRNA uracil 4-sulfurtransferase
MDLIIIHYAEIGTKGKNRPWFEKLLMENMKQQLKGLSYQGIKRIFGRILILGPALKEREEFIARLSKVFGISSFSFALSVPQTMKGITKGVGTLVVGHLASTFRVVTKRSQKQFPKTSPEINKEVGQYLTDTCGKTIDYVDAEATVFLEIVEKYAFVYVEKFPGPGGLPVGASGKMVVLLSGGIDSPVAAWYMMKRGCQPVYVHFHSHPYTNVASQDKVKKLVRVLQEYAPQTKLYFVPFINIQKQIMTHTDKQYRVILYRRYMMRIAEKISRKENAPVMVTGENLAQVASQTSKNLAAIEEAISLPVLRPLIGFDKQDIIEQAKHIGTYDISIEPHEDCCSLFIPKHPATKSDVKTLEIMEKKIDNSLIMDCVKKREKIIL